MLYLKAIIYIHIQPWFKARLTHHYALYFLILTIVSKSSSQCPPFPSMSLFFVEEEIIDRSIRSIRSEKSVLKGRVCHPGSASSTKTKQGIHKEVHQDQAPSRHRGLVSTTYGLPTKITDEVHTTSL
jgi:hypothetical protein